MRGAIASVAMSNVLREERKQQILAPGRLSWSLRADRASHGCTTGIASCSFRRFCPFLSLNGTSCSDLDWILRDSSVNASWSRNPSQRFEHVQRGRESLSRYKQVLG